MKISKSGLCIVTAITQMQCAFAISENSYSTELEQKVKPYWNNSTEIDFRGSDQVKVFTKFFNHDSDRLIVVIPGRTEPSSKYAELLYDLREIEADFLIIDPRGQGFSGRMLKDTQRGHVKKFSDYTRDLDIIIKFFKKTKGYHKIDIIAHSMGAAIALDYEEKFPEIIDRLVLSSPMVQIDTGKYSEPEAFLLLLGLIGIGKGDQYTLGEGPPNPNRKFENNNWTHSLARFEMAKNLEKENPYLQVGGPTNRWVYESLKAGHRITKDSDHINSPILMFQTKNDYIALPERQNKICNVTNCRKVYFENARHEMFQEKDEIRNVVLKETIEFLK